MGEAPDVPPNQGTRNQMPPTTEVPPTDGHWFEAVADHLGAAYLRYSFTKGTEQEVDFLVGALGLEPGMTVLDVGCGPGRHALALARRGLDVTGVDISQRFVDLANAAAERDRLARQSRLRSAPSDGRSPHAVPRHVSHGSARFLRADARALAYDGTFDAVISLCQGAFGLAGGPGVSSLDPDTAVVDGIGRAVRPGGLVALSAFSAYFQVRFLESTDDFDAATGVNHERTSIRSAAGDDAETDLWTTCFTPRELRLLCAGAGLKVRGLWSVTPGRYAPNPPDLRQPEYLVVATRPS